jgi:diguanylate cyclase (GGDEF)-like protein
LYLGVRIGILAVSLAITASGARRTFSPLGPDDAIALIASLALLVVLLRINVPMLSITYAHRRNMEPGRLTLELPVILTIFTVYGPIAAAALALLSYPLAIPADGRSRFMRRVLDGGAAALLWLALGVLRPLVLPDRFAFSLENFSIFIAFYVVAIFTFLLLIWMPLRALAQPSVSLLRLWRGLIRDTRLFTYSVLTMAWGYVCAATFHRAGIALGLATFLPLPFLATALRSVHNHRLELHRMRIARDAVQAMLRTRDPLPQMHALLGSLHTPAAEETLQIYAAISPLDMHLSPLATVGPIPDAEQLDRVRRVLGELQRSDRTSATQRTDLSTVTAYAARAPDEQLLGALVVHRPARTASLLPARRFAQAAAELSPLVRDFRSIAATQNAASLDPLTGLPNRRAIMVDLRAQIEQLAIGNPCALLILDLDHFKSINDLLGHQAGDQCLRAVGRIIAGHIRVHDRAGRIGGEEFVVMMPETTSDMARAVGERLRAAIQESDLRYADGKPVTASIGVAVASISDTVDSLLARADRALYQAKREGRNRVVEMGA